MPTFIVYKPDGTKVLLTCRKDRLHNWLNRGYRRTKHPVIPEEVKPDAERNGEAEPTK